MSPISGIKTNQSLSPFLRWAGSKRNLIPRLLRYWSDDRYERYVEPFMGSACLFFAIRPRQALLGDINKELINCFQTVRDHPLATFRATNKIPISRQAYYEMRARRYPEYKYVARASQFIYLNRFCFNGLYRTNLKGEFNVPYSPSKNGCLPTYEHLKLLSQSLKCSELVFGDFQALLEQVTANDFVYLDPPYVLSGRRVFREYGPKPFDFDDLSRLSDGLRAINEIGAHFVLSYAFCSEAKALFSNWNWRRIQVQRNISGFSQFRRKAIEMLVTNIDTQ